MPSLEEFVSSLPDDEVEVLLNDPELLAQAKAKYAAPTPVSQAPAQPGLLEQTAQGVKEGLKQTALGAAMSPLPLPVQGVMNLGKPLFQAADTLSRRGTRGIGVGLQTGDIQRAAEAVKPEFKPKEGERLGSFVGEHATDIIGGAAALQGLRPYVLPSAKRASTALGTIESKAGLKLRPTVEIPPSKRAEFLEEVAQVDPKGMNLQDLRDTMQTVKSVKKAATKVPETQVFAGQLEDKLRAELTRRLPERAAPAAEYARAKGRSAAIKKTLKVGGAALTGGGIGAFSINQLKKLFQ